MISRLQSWRVGPKEQDRVFLRLAIDIAAALGEAARRLTPAARRFLPWGGESGVESMESSPALEELIAYCLDEDASIARRQAA